jgi:predicted RNase H-like HicB family nuclease
MRYVVFIHKEAGSSYGVSFPDLPGLISAGDTADEALANAAEALAGHVAAMAADGEAAPGPRSLEAILADPALAEDREDATFAYVPLVRDRGSSVRVNISIDAGLLEAVDEAARSRGMTRSAFIASAVRGEILAA